MSGNSTAPGGDPSQAPQPLDAESLLTVLTFTLTLGPIALKFENQILLNVINTMAKFAMASQNFSIEASDLVNYFGARPQDVPYLFAQTDGPEGLANIVAIIAYQVEPLLPHERNTDVIVPLFSALTVMTTLAIALRLWSRHQIANGIKDFDFLAVLGYILAVIYGGLSVYRARIEGDYMRYYDKSWDNIRGSAKLYFILELLYPWAMCATKLSLLLFYYRMTKFNWVHYSCYAIAGLTIADTIASFITPFVVCRHFDTWNHKLEPTNCKFNTNIPVMVYGSIYILTDLAIWALPMPLVFKLKLKPREKVLAVITFSLGGVACVASGLRLWIIDTFAAYSVKASSNLEVDVYTVVELNLALICACAPSVRALIIYYTPKVLNKLESVGMSMSSDKTNDSEKSVGHENVTASTKS